MIPMKNIVRTAAAGLLACGLCATSVLPALADAPKNTSEAAVSGRKYYGELHDKVSAAKEEVNNCVIKYMPMDGEWMEGDHPFKPGDLFLCQPQLQSMESAMEALFSPDTPPLLWENSEQQERYRIMLAAQKEFYDLYLAPNKYLINLVDNDPEVTGVIIQVLQFYNWSLFMTPHIKEKFTELNSYIDRFKSTGDLAQLEPLSKFMTYSKGQVRFNANWDNTLYDIDRHTETILKEKRGFYSQLEKATLVINKMQEELKSKGPAIIASIEDKALKKRVQSVYDYLLEWTYKRAKLAFHDLRFWAMELFDSKHPMGMVFSTKNVAKYAPNFRSVDSESYREMIKETLQYYVPNNVTIMMGKGIFVDGQPLKK